MYTYEIPIVTGSYFLNTKNTGDFWTQTGRACELTSASMRYNNNQSSLAMDADTGTITFGSDDVFSFTDGFISLSIGS